MEDKREKNLNPNRGRLKLSERFGTFSVRCFWGRKNWEYEILPVKDTFNYFFQITPIQAATRAPSVRKVTEKTTVESMPEIVPTI